MATESERSKAEADSAVATSPVEHSSQSPTTKPKSGRPSLSNTPNPIEDASNTIAPSSASKLTKRPAANPRPTSPNARSSPQVDSIHISKNEDGPYASRPSHYSLSEGANPKSRPSEYGESSKGVRRKPVPSMASTIAPTSPTLTYSDTIIRKDKPDNTPQPPARSNTNVQRQIVDIYDDPDSKTRAFAEDPDDLPPAYEAHEVQPTIFSPPPPAVFSPPPSQMPPPDSNINRVDEEGCPYIVKAARENMAAVVQVLLERGVNIEAVHSGTWRTAVMEAARLGRVEIAEMLIRAGCRLDRPDQEGNTVLHYCVEGGSTQTLEQILATGKIPIDARGHQNRTALHVAADIPNASIAAMLLRHSADPTMKDTAQRTPLHIAAMRGNVELCEILLDEGAELDSLDQDGKTALQLAAGTDQTGVVGALLARNEAPSKKKKGAVDPALLTGFYEAVRVGNVRMAQGFLAKGVTLRKLKEPWKPAALAAQSGNLDMLKLMIDNKCSLKEKSPQGWTPLHYAASLGHQGIVAKLLEEKVSWKATTKETEETALHLAIGCQHVAAAEALIFHKDANVDVEDSEGQQPLHHAVRFGLPILTQGLLGKGAKANNANGYGWKPIHLAAAYGRTALAADLIARGVSVEEKLTSPSVKPAKVTHAAVRRGYSAEARWPHPATRPLALALEFGQDSVANMLLANGAKIDSQDIHGWRPLHHAAFACNPELVEALLQRGANPHATTTDNNTALALGFRTSGLPYVGDKQREAVRAVLQEAMRVSKPPRFEAFRRGVSFGGSSAAQRNTTWHTAEMASALRERSGSLGPEATLGAWIGASETSEASDAYAPSGGSGSASASQFTPSTHTGDDDDNNNDRTISPSLSTSKSSNPSKSPESALPPMPSRAGSLSQQQLLHHARQDPLRPSFPSKASWSNDPRDVGEEEARPPPPPKRPSHPTMPSTTTSPASQSSISSSTWPQTQPQPRPSVGGAAPVGAVELSASPTVLHHPPELDGRSIAERFSRRGPPELDGRSIVEMGDGQGVSPAGAGRNSVRRTVDLRPLPLFHSQNQTVPAELPAAQLSPYREGDPPPSEDSLASWSAQGRK